jgi:hypothetical protein
VDLDINGDVDRPTVKYSAEGGEQHGEHHVRKARKKILSYTTAPYVL